LNLVEKGIQTIAHLHYLLLKLSQDGFNELNYPLVSNLNYTMTNKYPLLTNDRLLFPASFIIDKEGIIPYCMVNNLLCGKSVNELLRILKSI
jgi:peroxiredoxin (alkyl hydroperoxide reductase subunit C)